VKKKQYFASRKRSPLSNHLANVLILVLKSILMQAKVNLLRLTTRIKKKPPENIFSGVVTMQGNLGIEVLEWLGYK